MDEELIKAIIKGLKEKGQNENLIKLFQLETEDDLQTTIDGLGTSETKTFLELLEDNKGYQSDFDKLISKATKKREENIKKTYNLVRKENFKDDLDDATDPDDMTPIEKMQKQIDKMSNLISTQEQTQTLEKRKGKAHGLLKEAKIPERYIQFFDFSKEDSPLEEQFETISSEFKEFKQSILDETQQSTGFPIPKDMGQKVSEKEIDDIIDNL